MTPHYDVAVIGAGHNGLVAAAYLARAGRSVVVLDQREALGGLAGTVEFAPGFRAPMCFPTVDRFHPVILRELELDGHGLQIVTGSTGTYLPRAEGAHLLVDGRGGTNFAVHGITEPDAVALAEFQHLLDRVGRGLEPVFTEPLPQVERRSVGDLVDLLRLGWRLRSLGQAEAQEVLRLLPMCVRDVLDERFSGAALKAALALPALLGSWLGPRSPGSLFGLLHHRPAWYRPLFARPRYAVGGPGALMQALGAAASAAGADIRLASPVARILVRDGEAHGVLLSDGEDLTAGTVLSSASPVTTLSSLVEPEWLAPEFAGHLRTARARGTVAAVRFALDAVPQFAGAPAEEHLGGRIQIGASLDALERAFDDVKYGTFPETPALECYVPTLVDDTLAPAGQHVLFAWVQHVPHSLAQGSWTTRRDELGDAVTSLLEVHAPGFGDRVLHRDVTTPEDFERGFGVPGGCVYHLELALDQVLYMRPFPGWYHHGTPIRGLYLCGSGTHAGGGIVGLPGRNAAHRVLRDAKKGRAPMRLGA